MVAGRRKVPTRFSMEESWLSYEEWASVLTKECWSNLLKAGRIGVHLDEPHLLSNAVVYVWNYDRHLIQAGRLVNLIPTFKGLLLCMKNLSKPRSGTLFQQCSPPLIYLFVV